MNCPNCGTAMNGTGRMVGPREVLECPKCEATAVNEADSSGAATAVDEDLRLDERDGA